MKLPSNLIWEIIFRQLVIDPEDISNRMAPGQK